MEIIILIIHSKKDNITPLFMAEDIYNSIEHDKKKKFLVEDSQHAEIYFDYKNEYKDMILDFINY